MLAEASQRLPDALERPGLASEKPDPASGGASASLRGAGEDGRVLRQKGPKETTQFNSKESEDSEQFQKKLQRRILCVCYLCLTRFAGCMIDASKLEKVIEKKISLEFHY